MRDMVTVFLACLLFMFVVLATVGIVNLSEENKILKEENHMLKNTLADFGAEIEELSTTVDRLMENLNRGNDWNEEAIPEYRR